MGRFFAFSSAWSSIYYTGRSRSVLAASTIIFLQAQLSFDSELYFQFRIRLLTERIQAYTEVLGSTFVLTSFLVEALQTLNLHSKHLHG